jgi:hypothetical protein
MSSCGRSDKTRSWELSAMDGALGISFNWSRNSDREFVIFFAVWISGGWRTEA